jgi:phosphoglycerate kinase
MAAKSISELDLQGRRIFIRLDLDVPITPAGGVSDPERIRACLPTIKHAIERGGRVVLATQLGQPKGHPRPELTLLPIAAYLAESLGRELVLADEPAGDGAKKVVHDLRDGSVAMLENLGFSPAELGNDETLARMLASYADVYVNDAFSTLSRSLSSTVGMVKYVPAKGIGFQVERELKFLGKLIGEVEKPLVVVLGGTKVKEEFGLLESLLGRASAICLGGVLANTFLRARGANLGGSLVEESKLPLARAFLTKAEAAGVQIVLPKDLVVATDLHGSEGITVRANQVPDSMAAFDVGPETVAEFTAVLAKAHTVLWHGPLGVAENNRFSEATYTLAKSLANLLGVNIAVGNDTVNAIHRAGATANFTHLSAGSTAALEYIEGKKLPGLTALES